MYTILKKELLNSNEIYLMEIHAPWIAKGGQPGQFVIVIPHDKGERVPLTICDIHPERESVDIVYQVVGESTRRLSRMAEGESLFSSAPWAAKASSSTSHRRNATTCACSLWREAWALPRSIHR